MPPGGLVIDVLAYIAADRCITVPISPEIITDPGQRLFARCKLGRLLVRSYTLSSRVILKKSVHGRI